MAATASGLAPRLLPLYLASLIDAGLLSLIISLGPLDQDAFSDDDATVERLLNISIVSGLYDRSVVKAEVRHEHQAAIER